MNSNGQITIPAKLRKKLGLHPGTKVEVNADENGSISITPEKKIVHRSELHKLAKTDVVLSDEELEEAISHAFRPSDVDQYGK